MASITNTLITMLLFIDYIFILYLHFYNTKEFLFISVSSENKSRILCFLLH